MKDGYLQAYAWFWVRRYLAVAYFRLGDEAKGEAELRAIHEDMAKSEPDKIDEARKDLAELAAKDAAIAGPIDQALGWFKKKSYDLSPAENAANRRWWQTVPEHMRAALLSAAKVEADEIDDDAQLARVCDVESCEIDDDDDLPRIDDATVFAHLQALTRLTFFGDPETLEPQRSLPQLERVTLNGRVIRHLRLPPTRKNKALFGAIAKDDRAGIAAALAAGADIRGKNDDGDNVLFYAQLSADDLDDEVKPDLLKHLVELARRIVLRGNNDGNTIASYIGQEAFAELEAIYSARGGAPPGSPFRRLEPHRQGRPASFGQIDGLPDGMAIETDEPLPVLPKEAFVAMRTDYGGYKKETELRDYHETQYSAPIVSARSGSCSAPPASPLRPSRFATTRGSRSTPATSSCTHARSNVSTRKRASPSTQPHRSTSFSNVQQVVIDEARVPADVAMFRLQHMNNRGIYLRKELAEALAKAEVTGLSFALPKR